GLDQMLEVLGTAVRGLRGEGQGAVVAPTTPARAFGYGHQLERRNAERDEMVELFLDCGVRARGRERADVQLVEHRLAPWTSAPVAVLPVELPRVNHLAGAVHVDGVEAGSRVRHAQRVVAERERVAVAGGGIGGYAGVEPVLLREHRPVAAAL